MPEKKTELPTMPTSVKISGLVKNVELDIKQTKDNRPYIGGHVDIQVEEDGKTNLFRVRAMSMQFKRDGNINPMYNGLVTVASDYKTIDDNTKEEADFVTVTGDVQSNTYKSSNSDKVLTAQQIQGRFFNRIEDESKKVPEATAQVAGVMTNLTDETDKDGLPTGAKNVTLLTVGYNNRVSEIKTVVLPDLADAFMSAFEVGGVYNLQLKLERYAVEPEQDTKTSSDPFGGPVKSLNTFETFVSRWIVVAGDPNYNAEGNVTEEDVKAIEAKRVEDVKAVELDNNSSAKPASTQPAGGGNNPFGKGPVQGGNPFGGPQATDAGSTTAPF